MLQLALGTGKDGLKLLHSAPMVDKLYGELEDEALGSEIPYTQSVSSPRVWMLVVVSPVAALGHGPCNALLPTVHQAHELTRGPCLEVNTAWWALTSHFMTVGLRAN